MIHKGAGRFYYTKKRIIDIVKKTEFIQKHTLKRFISINEDFECLNCKTYNNKLEGGCRNHCKNCLYSLHLDKENPGDRLSNCKSLMEPISITQSGKKGWIIIHRCKKCKKTIQNKSANDDNFQEIIKLSQ